MRKMLLNSGRETIVKNKAMLKYFGYFCLLYKLIFQLAL